MDEQHSRLDPEPDLGKGAADEDRLAEVGRGRTGGRRRAAEPALLENG